MFMVLKRISFQLAAAVSVNYDKNRCESLPTCSKAVLRFQIQLRDMIHNSICFILMGHYHKSAALHISAVFWTHEHIKSQRVFWNRSFKAFKFLHFSESITSDILNLWKWSFFKKRPKFYVDFEKGRRLSENVDGFEDNFIWTCCGTFSQLWQEYRWSAVNVLKSGPQISDSTKRHDTQLNLFDINGKLA